MVAGITTRADIRCIVLILLDRKGWLLITYQKGQVLSNYKLTSHVA